jgi:hypothetical protein
MYVVLCVSLCDSHFGAASRIRGCPDSHTHFSDSLVDPVLNLCDSDWSCTRKRFQWSSTRSIQWDCTDGHDRIDAVKAVYDPPEFNALTFSERVRVHSTPGDEHHSSWARGPWSTRCIWYSASFAEGPSTNPTLPVDVTFAEPRRK